jgi:hypothetical protein
LRHCEALRSNLVFHNPLQIRVCLFAKPCPPVATVWADRRRGLTTMGGLFAGKVVRPLFALRPFSGRTTLCRHIYVVPYLNVPSTLHCCSYLKSSDHSAAFQKHKGCVETIATVRQAHSDDVLMLYHHLFKHQPAAVLHIFYFQKINTTG